ncbi:MAG: hypothetical protein LBL79_06750 [Prevotella sp.]|jgi:hypothetical protein|nr:hypothetical protein [Prevotella sp.]
MRQFNLITDKIAANKKSHFRLFFGLLLVLSMVMMFLYSPIEGGHDFYYHMRRMNALTDSLRNGTYPIYLDYGGMNGYGYLSKIFYCDFLLLPFGYIGIFTDAVFAYKCLIFTVTMLCGILTYHTVKVICKSSFAAAVASLTYTFAIYRLIDVFQRAALGESISFTFIPIAFLGIYYLLRGDYRKWYVLAIGFSLLVFTHVIATFLMFLTMVIILAVNAKKLIRNPKIFFCMGLAGVATLIVTAYYIYPFLEQAGSSTFYFRTRTNDGLFYGSAMPIGDIMGGMLSAFPSPDKPYLPRMGLLLTLVILLRVFLLKKLPRLTHVDIGVLIGLLFILSVSFRFPWHVFPFNQLTFIQFPWRFYEFSTYFFAVAGGYYLLLLIKTDRGKILALAVIAGYTLILLITDSKNFKINAAATGMSEQTGMANNYNMGGLEYFPAKVPSLEYVVERGDSIKTIYEDTRVTNFERNEGITSFDVEILHPEKPELPIFYYKGYEAELNGKVIPLEESDNGLIRIPVGQSGSVKVYYKGTIVQKVSWYITNVSIFALCIYIFVRKKKKRS